MNCGGPCGSAPSTQIDLASSWHHYVLEVVASASASANDRVRLYVDGALRIDVTPWIGLQPLTRAANIFGISYARLDARGTLLLDDAYFDVR